MDERHEQQLHINYFMWHPIKKTNPDCDKVMSLYCNQQVWQPVSGCVLALGALCKWFYDFFKDTDWRTVVTVPYNVMMECTAEWLWQRSPYGHTSSSLSDWLSLQRDLTGWLCHSSSYLHLCSFKSTYWPLLLTEERHINISGTSLVR